MLDHVNDSTDQAHALAKTLKDTPSKLILFRLTRSRARTTAVPATRVLTVLLRY